MIYRIQNEHCLLKNILRHKKKSCFARIYLFSSPLTIPNWKLEVGNKWFVMFQLWHQKKMKRNDILILHQIISKGETDVQWDWLMLQDIMQNLFISISFGHSFLFKPFLKQQNGIVIRNYFCILSKNKIFSTQNLSFSLSLSLSLSLSVSLWLSLFHSVTPCLPLLFKNVPCLMTNVIMLKYDKR